MLTMDVAEFTRSMNSSMIFGGWPAAGITVGAEMSFATIDNYIQTQLVAIEVWFGTQSLAVHWPD